MVFPLTRAVGYAARVAKETCTSADLEILFMQSGLTYYQPYPTTGGWRYNEGYLLASKLGNAERAASEEGDEDAASGLKAFICLIAEQCGEDDLVQLRESGRSAGFDLRVDGGRARLLPLDEPHAPLGNAITALEADLDRLGMSTASNHYRQAVDSLVDGRHEAANAQLRATFEEVVAHLASLNGFTRNRQGAGGNAIRYLVENDHLPPDDGGDFIRGLWKIVQTNGPHPGTSPAGETHFRTQAITAAARFLVDRFAPAIGP